MDKLDMHSPDKVDENITKIGNLFPNCITETLDDNGKPVKGIDFDILKQELSKVVVDGPKERYQFTWPDKKKSMLLANSPISATLRPCRSESVNFDTTENLYIEGDNLDVLKLLQETYLGKVKMIYIDPPYNTGKDSFVYDDDFSVDADKYFAYSGQFDTSGNRLVQNIESNGRFHTDWLNMIYPRLKLARELLADDGVIFISIDDNEQENLKKICDELFGSDNHLSIHHIQVRYANKSLNEKKAFQECIEQVLIYAKDSKKYVANQPYEDYSLDPFCYEVKELLKGNDELIGNKKVTVFKKGEYELIKHKEGNINLLKGTWASGTVVKGNTSGKYFETYLKPRKKIDGLGTLYKVDGIGEDGLGYRYFSGPNKDDATQGVFYSGVPLSRLDEIKEGSSKKYKTITNFYDFSGDFGNISHEGGIAFNSGKKPVKMLKQFLNYHKKNDITVLDFFSGSASTAHAVMQLNADDGGKRKFIMVQIPEATDESSEAFKAGYKNICEIGKERIRRAGKKVKEEAGLNGQNLDIGFRVLKLDSSNMKNVYYSPEAYVNDPTLFDQVHDNIKEDRSGEDLLFQVMLDLGIELSADIKTENIAGKNVYSVKDNYLIACFDNDVTDEILTQIAKRKPFYAVLRDSSFTRDDTASNFEQIFATWSPETIKKVL